MSVIDHTAFPHIFEAIIELSSRNASPTLRATCKALRDVVDAKARSHVAVVDKELYASRSGGRHSIHILSPSLTREPCFASWHLMAKAWRGCGIPVHPVWYTVVRVVDFVYRGDTPENAFHLVPAAEYTNATIVRLRFDYQPTINLRLMPKVVTVVVFPFNANLAILDLWWLPRTTTKLVVHLEPSSDFLFHAPCSTLSNLESVSDLVYILPPPGLAPETYLSEHQVHQLAQAIVHDALSQLKHRENIARTTIVGLSAKSRAALRPQALNYHGLKPSVRDIITRSLRFLTRPEYAAEADPVELAEIVEED